MSVIIHASRDFAKRLRCELSLPGEKIVQSGRLDSWSAHFVRIARKPVVLMMNDATLWSVIIPASGVTTLPKLLPIFLNQVAEVWGSHGVGFDPLNQSVVFFSRSNRSLIGSMNDAVSQMHFSYRMAREENRPMDWDEMATALNRMPYGALKYDRPLDRMAELLKVGD